MSTISTKVYAYIARHEREKIITKYNPFSRYDYTSYDRELFFLKKGAMDFNDSNEKRFETVYSTLRKILTNGLPNDHNGIVRFRFNADIIKKEYVKPNIYKKFLEHNLIKQTINETDGYMNWEINFNNKPISNDCYVFEKYKKLWEKSINPLDDDDMESAIKIYNNSKQEITNLEIAHKKLNENLNLFGINIELTLKMPLTSSHEVNSTYNNFLNKLESNINRELNIKKR